MDEPIDSAEVRSLILFQIIINLLLLDKFMTLWQKFLMSINQRRQKRRPEIICFQKKLPNYYHRAKLLRKLEGVKH